MGFFHIVVMHQPINSQLLSVSPYLGCGRKLDDFYSNSDYKWSRNITHKCDSNRFGFAFAVSSH